MKYSFIFIILLISLVEAPAQNNLSANSESIENISRETTKISKSLEALNEKIKIFSETFSSNQGLRLSEKQQRLLAAFEYLNRAEHRLATLQKLKIDLTELQSSIKTRIANNEDSLRPESIDRSIVVRGTTNAEELREIRRQVLYRERSELTALFNEIQNTLNDTNVEIRQTEIFLRSIRQRIFPEIEKELSDL